MFPSFDKLIDAEFAQNSRLLAAAGFSDGDAAAENLIRLRASSGGYERHRIKNRTHSVPPWYKTLKRILAEAPNPGPVLATVDQFVGKCSQPEKAFALFEESPRSLELLARLSCGSPFLTQVVLSQPEAVWHLTAQRRTAEMKPRELFCEEALRGADGFPTEEQKLAELRRYQRREILRIGMCDAFGLMDLKFVTLQLSLLADAMVQACLRIACRELQLDQPPFCVIALGKHGGEELNYSSDIDLILISENSTDIAQRVARRLIDGLSQKLSTGFLYRVDMRLRPWGDAGPLVSTPESYRDYLASHADLWEKQALLKARVIAGDMQPGMEFLQQLPEVLFQNTASDVLDSVRRMKGRIEDRLRRHGKLHTEVKLGAGSIRDIEFLAQALQLIHGRREPRLASANTLDALVRLAEFSVIDASEYRQLREGYVFLRTIEHALQLLHNQQTHELPADPEQRRWLTRRLDFYDEGQLLTRFDEHRRAVRRIFDSYFHPQRFSTIADVPASTAESDDGPEPEWSAGTELRLWMNRHREDQCRLADHLLSEVGESRTCRVHCERLAARSRQMIVTLAAPDTVGLLSIVCGVFFANRLDIREGVSHVGESLNPFGQRIPVDSFLGIFLVQETAMNGGDAGTSPGALSRRLHDELCRLLAVEHAGSRSDVREELLDMFCRRLAEMPAAPQPQAEIKVTVEGHPQDGKTRLNIEGDDTFGFLFEVANALSLCRFRIRTAELGSADGRIKDTLLVTEADGSAVTQTERMEELQTAITLIKQFTNWLPRINDPHQALLRFRDLLQRLLRDSGWENRVATLHRPGVLETISRVLGMSRYLWEDFLQVHHDKLLPLLTEPERLKTRISAVELAAECRSSVGEATTPAAAEEALNAFKDYHLFRVDLRHVLGHCGAFGSFSEEVTEIAEVVVVTASRMAHAELAASHGLPRLKDGQPCSFTLAALGKFAGIEMGFASDIEMFLVFDAECRTDGSPSLSAGSFFERLMNRIPELIKARRKGIFEIDLRMRPYGQAGSTAVSLASFEQYFGPAGDAWPYERQALVKLRCVGGDPEFAERLHRLVQSIVYSSQSVDFAAMRAMREKQIRQLVRPGTVNAKLSSGGLVDCEYAVQALQLTFGATISALRSPNTMNALTAASEHGLISAVEYSAIEQAYQFLRELIDCLRMVRGNAEDLTVPERESADYAQLSRRLEAVHDSAISLDEIDRQMETVRMFAERVEIICAEGNGLHNATGVSRR
ncbi:MAG: DUF294 nucleotidyltransferase-like domain-containing protein [Fuerstiella sp.]